MSTGQRDTSFSATSHSPSGTAGTPSAAASLPTFTCWVGVDDKEIQAILRNSNISITQNIYIKSVSESQVNAMDSLSEKFATCNDLATKPTGRIQ